VTSRLGTGKPRTFFLQCTVGILCFAVGHLYNTVVLGRKKGISIGVSVNKCGFTNVKAVFTHGVHGCVKPTVPICFIVKGNNL
jgi:hypothetical protein